VTNPPPENAPENAQVNTIEEIDVRRLAELLGDSSAIPLLDVRETWEREVAHLPQSEMLDEAKAKALIEGGDRKLPLYFICHHGIRSLSAAQFFASHGFEKVYSVAGGIDAWSREIDPEMPTY